MSPHLTKLWKILVDTWGRFNAHGDLLAAAVSFYTLLSIAPLGVVALSIAGTLFGREEARVALIQNVRRIASDEIAHVLVKQLDAAEQSSGKVAAAVALAVLIGAASRLFVQLQEALNVIWGVRSNEARSARATILRYLTKRLLSFAMVMGTGGLLLGVLVLQTLVSDVSGLAQKIAPDAWVSGAVGLTEQVFVPLGLLSVSCAVVYRVLPDVRVRFRDVWVGAVLTAVLVLLGTWLLGLYLTRIAPGWLQGAVGSIAVFMVWTYYLAQVFLLGAAFTRVWSCRHGDATDPREDARMRSDAP